MAFNPATGLVYFPGQETSAVFQNVETFEFKVGQWNTGTRRGANPPAAPPTTGSSTRGFFVAWNPVTQQARWRIDFRPSGGALSTAGNLIFAGDSTGRFVALDPATGATVWQTELLTGVATPVTYQVDGKQYISVMSGTTEGRVFTFALDSKESMPRP
jgi:outer membrane protein assembly factor BamB